MSNFCYFLISVCNGEIWLPFRLYSNNTWAIQDSPKTNENDIKTNATFLNWIKGEPNGRLVGASCTIGTVNGSLDYICSRKMCFACTFQNQVCLFKLQKTVII